MPSSLYPQRRPGLVLIRNFFEKDKIGFQICMETAEDWIRIFANEHERKKYIHSIIKETNKFKRKFHEDEKEKVMNNPPITVPKTVRKATSIQIK